MTMFGDFPPHSTETRFMFDCPAYCMTMRPVAVDPVKVMQSTSICRASALPAVCPNPGTTFSTPSGIPASTASPAIRSAVSGDFSDGFKTSELPAANTGPIFHAAMSSGKFQGTIAPTTPIGSRVINASVSDPVGATSSYTLSIASAYQRMQFALPGISTLKLSRMGLPISSVSSSASSSPCLSMRSANFCRIFFRRAGARPDQLPLRKAARDEATARFTSSVSQAATRASTAPVDGLMQSNVCPETASTYFPSIKA